MATQQISNPQIDSLKAKLRASGVSLEITNSFTEPGTTRVWTRYRTYRPTSRAVTFVIVDFQSDGYALLLEAHGNDIDADVAAILAKATTP